MIAPTRPPYTHTHAPAAREILQRSIEQALGGKRLSPPERRALDRQAHHPSLVQRGIPYVLLCDAAAGGCGGSVKGTIKSQRELDGLQHCFDRIHEGCVGGCQGRQEAVGSRQ